jgi:hypothetical protein
MNKAEAPVGAAKNKTGAPDGARSLAMKTAVRYIRHYPSLIVAGLALAVVVAAPVLLSAANEMKASVSFLKGMARLQHKGSTQVSNIALGSSLIEGDTVITLENAKLELKLENGTVVRLGGSSKFTLSTLQRTSSGGIKGLFNVAKGRLWFTVAKMTGDSELQTQTPTVIAAVKGTVWRADVAADGQTDMVVYDGVVTATRQGEAPVEVGKMEKLAAMPNSAFEKSSYDESQDDRDDWAKWNKNRDKLRIMIIMPEKHDSVKADASISENAMVNRFLNNYMFKLIDKEQVDKIRDSEKLKAALKGDNTAAAAAGLEVGADLIVVGEANVKYFKSPALGGLISATANMTGRAVRADTAEIIAAQPGLTSRAVDITDDAAAQKALIQTGEKMASMFVDSIMEKWRREVRKGTGLEVVVDGVDYKKLKVITNKLAELDGVKDVQSLYLVGQRSLLNVTFGGDSTSLAEEIEKVADWGGLKVGVVGLSAYKLEMEVRGNVKAPAPAVEPPAAKPAETAPQSATSTAPAAEAKPEAPKPAPAPAGTPAKAE